jgi:predicted choloylglycine hydrolase
MKAFFDHYEFKGSHYEVGLQHGEALRDQIRHHLETIYELAAKVSLASRERLLNIAELYRPYIEGYAPDFLTELEGMARGAEITMEEALLLQARQEVVNLKNAGAADRECTSFAIKGSCTVDGKAYSGQNADLNGNFEEFSNVVTFSVEGKPLIMMVTPAGQISYQGMNDEGLSVNCNFLACNGWRKGFPRYLISRLMLEESTFDRACARLEGLRELAASRNVLLCDEKGNMINYETTPERVAAIRDAGDYFVHSNHFLHPEMLCCECESDKENSICRLKRLTELIEKNKGRISADMLKTFLRDHENGKNSICMHRDPDKEVSYHTFASIINHLADRYMEAAKGNPCTNEFSIYKF